MGLESVSASDAVIGDLWEKCSTSIALTGRTSVKSRLPAHSSIFSVKAIAMSLALGFIEYHTSNGFIIVSDYFSCLQAMNA